MASNFVVRGNTAVSGSTYLSGSTTITGSLSVTGSTILSGSQTTIYGNFAVSGSTYLSGSTSVFNTFNVTGSTILSGSTTVIGTDNVPARIVTATTGELHVYADGTAGDDANTGLTVGSPKKTLQAVFDLVPYLVKHNTCVHLVGTFTNVNGVLNISFRSLSGTVPILIIDGGDSLTDIVADTTSDINSVSSIGLSTAGWVTDAYEGYFVEILTGAAIGQQRMIQGNNATTLTPTVNFSVDPGVGAHFRIVRPTTEIAGTSQLRVSAVLEGMVSVQRLYFSGTSSLRPMTHGAYSTTGLNFASIISDSTSWAAFVLPETTGGVVLSISNYSPVTFATNSLNKSAVSLQHTAATYGFYVRARCVVNVNACAMRKISVLGTAIVDIGYGTRVHNLSFTGSPNSKEFTQISTAAGFATTRIGGTGVGLTLVDSAIKIVGAVDISNCTSHAIECNHSRLHLDGAVTGGTNTGAGVYAHNGSVVNIKNGAPPTLTGTVGDLAVSSPAAVESTWAAIDAGTPVAVLSEMTMAKEVA